jgi:hypothetical protein
MYATLTPDGATPTTENRMLPDGRVGIAWLPPHPTIAVVAAAAIARSALRPWRWITAGAVYDCLDGRAAEPRGWDETISNSFSAEMSCTRLVEVNTGALGRQLKA